MQVYKDYSTKNESFLKVATQLKEKGIKNYDFMLTLLDKDLQDVNPHDPKLSIQMKEKISIEISKNIWYYFREFLKIDVQGGGKARFKLTKLTATMIYLYLNNKNQYVNGHRMSYKSQTAELLKKYNYSKNLLHISDAEFVKENIYDFYQENKSKENIIMIFESVVNDIDNNGHSKLRESATIWNDYCFDIPIDELSDFYYVYYEYAEIVDDPESFYKNMCISLLSDYNMIRREVLLERKLY